MSPISVPLTLVRFDTEIKFFSFLFSSFVFSFFFSVVLSELGSRTVDAKRDDRSRKQSTQSLLLLGNR